MNNTTKTREMLFVWDVTKANPNGDMLNENRPRMDETTGHLEASDVRIKRFVRDYWMSIGKRVLVRQETDEKGNVLSAQQLIDRESKNDKLSINDKKADISFANWLFEKFIDVRLFGAVVTKPKYNITGPLQINWSRSLHEAEVTIHQGNAAYASGDNKAQASIWTKYMTPYAAFKTNMVFNSLTANLQNIPITEDDISEFKTGLINGLKNYRSTSKNQMPRILIEIIYKQNDIDGDMEMLNYFFNKEPLALRDISEIQFDASPLKQYFNLKQNAIEKINVYIDKKVQIKNLPEEWIKEM